MSFGKPISLWPKHSWAQKTKMTLPWILSTLMVRVTAKRETRVQLNNNMFVLSEDLCKPRYHHYDIISPWNVRVHIWKQRWSTDECLKGLPVQHYGKIVFWDLWRWCWGNHLHISWCVTPTCSAAAPCCKVNVWAVRGGAGVVLTFTSSHIALSSVRTRVVWSGVEGTTMDFCRVKNTCRWELALAETGTSTGSGRHLQTCRHAYIRWSRGGS